MIRESIVSKKYAWGLQSKYKKEFEKYGLSLVYGTWDEGPFTLWDLMLGYNKPGAEFFEVVRHCDLNDLFEEHGKEEADRCINEWIKETIEELRNGKKKEDLKRSA